MQMSYARGNVLPVRTYLEEVAVAVEGLGRAGEEAAKWQKRLKVT